ncbi:uncharacterized protein LOC104887045 [Beta vulgaris subsp. vulgaris]|uniref:uncharacterized protein LOC104887045 n=1 Tax=Beta vulgaris subsp. vulgaris TaxID=3555 RepID=UPI00053F842A|nr:uncharacterized protein LOC104887045 [Beta vulgaris subsp. vulgaris]
MLTNQAESDLFPKVIVSELDREKIRTPHDDPLVVEMKIANLRVRQILIDTGSSTDIISADCLSRLKFDENDLVPVNHLIMGFGGGIIHPMGTVTLPVRVGDKEASRTLFVKFLVVRDLTAYNVILGRPTLNHIKAVIVTHLMLMKFECDGGKIGSADSKRMLPYHSKTFILERRKTRAAKGHRGRTNPEGRRPDK